MPKVKLTEAHPDQQKFQKLVDLANELNISIEFNGSKARFRIEDRSYEIEDIEFGHHISSFPHDTEWMLTYIKAQ